MRGMNLSSIMLGNCEYILLMFGILVVMRAAIVLIREYQIRKYAEKIASKSEEEKNQIREKQSTVYLKQKIFLNRIIIYFIEGNLTMILLSSILDISTINKNIGALKIVSFIFSIILLISILTVYLQFFYKLFLVESFN